ncbi:MAG: glycosyltransferase family 39 protein [Pyrinomonadaceae bacterium]
MKPGWTRTTEALATPKDSWTGVWLRPRRLLIAAGVFHLVVTISIYGLGRYSALPGTFDHNGIAISFAPDGVQHLEEAVNLSDGLAGGQIRDWLAAASPFHLKLYSICFAFLRPWVGSNILSAEPLNVLCYLTVLVLIFKVAQEIFNPDAGLIAAATVALWPSFLLHTTQLLKDPLFVVGMLAFIFVNLRLLSRNFSWQKALMTGAGGGLIAVFLWLARDSMGELPIAAVALGAAMLIVRQFWEKHFQAANLVAMALLIMVSVGVTRVVPEFQKPDAPWVGSEKTRQDSVSTAAAQAAEFKSSETLPLNPWSRIVARVGKVRQRFAVQYPDATSNIDQNVQLTSTGDLIRYLPRAAAIGFLAPFPNMWLATGMQVGSAGRLISGLETMAMYVVEALAIVALWRDRPWRRKVSVCFLWLVAAMGMISLGLVVVNVGALYRLRYVFWILLIILATGEAAQILDWRKRKRSAGSGLVANT